MKRINWPQLSSTDHDFLSTLVNRRSAQLSGSWQQWNYDSLGKPIASVRISIAFETYTIYSGQLPASDNSVTLAVSVSPEAEFQVKGISNNLFVGACDTCVYGGLMFGWDDSNRYQFLVDHPDAAAEFFELVAAAYERSQRSLELLMGRLMA